MKYKNRQGQSLIEILIAISAITIVLVSLVSAATRSLSGSVSARTQALATKLAEGQMEKIRAYRDRNGLSSISCADKCYLNDSLLIPFQYYSNLYLLINLLINKFRGFSFCLDQEKFH